MSAPQQQQKPDQVIEPPKGTSVERLMAPPSSAPSTDDLVRQKLAAESAALRQKEADILAAISTALEKENLDRDRANPGMTAQLLGKDIDDVRDKVERIRSDKLNRESEGVRSAKAGVVKCYLNNPQRPLDCWKEVAAFKNEVSKLESAFVKSLQ